MSERRPSSPADRPTTDGGRRRYGVPACEHARDSVDRLLLDWERERPDLDFTPVGILTRLARLRGRMDAELGAVFARFDLTAADFTVIVTLRRSGAPYAMPQARLMTALGLTSGTVSVRLDRLERNGIVTREPAPGSPRGSTVRLTDKGVHLFDELAPAHLRNEDRLLSALDADERQQLADLLRRLLADVEGPMPQPLLAHGARIEPAHLARSRRLAVGLTDAAGLLVSDVAAGSVAERAGLERGDLITSIDGLPVTSSIHLAQLLDDRPGATVAVGGLRGDAVIRIDLVRPAGSG